MSSHTAGSSIMEDVVHSSKKHHKGAISPLATVEIKSTRHRSPLQHTSIDLESDRDNDSSSESEGTPKYEELTYQLCDVD